MEECRDRNASLAKLHSERAKCRLLWSKRTKYNTDNPSSKPELILLLYLVGLKFKIIDFIEQLRQRQTIML
jgi:hypothetical protein